MGKSIWVFYFDIMFGKRCFGIALQKDKYIKFNINEFTKWYHVYGGLWVFIDYWYVELFTDIQHIRDLVEP